MRHLMSAAFASLMSTAAMAEVPRVVTDLPPVQSLVAQVMGDLGAADLLLPRGASEHGFQLRPSQAAGLQDAGLVVWVGPELTPWLATALDGVPASVPRLELLTVAGTALRPYPDAGGQDGSQATKAATDPHAWLDPSNAEVWLAAIAAELSRIDPDNAASYAANAQAAIAATEALDAEVQATLAPVAGTPIVVFHEAYGYLAARYGLDIAGAAALGDAAAPGAARLRALQATVAGGGKICLFPEPQYDPALLAQLTDGTGAVMGGAIDPVGTTLEPGPGLYADLMRGMAATIAACVAPS